MWKCPSISPGMSTLPPRSTTRWLPFGFAPKSSVRPTAVIRLPSTLTAAFSIGSPPFPSIRRQLRNSVGGSGMSRLMRSSPSCGLRRWCRDDRVREGSDSLDLHADDVADLHVALAHDVVAIERLAADLGIGGPCGAARRAGLEQKAGLQRGEVREERDDLRDAPDHLGGRVGLPHLVVDIGAELQVLRIRNLGPRHDPGPEGCRGVEVLARPERVLPAALRVRD